MFPCFAATGFLACKIGIIVLLRVAHVHTDKTLETDTAFLSRNDFTASMDEIHQLRMDMDEVLKVVRNASTVKMKQETKSNAEARRAKMRGAMRSMYVLGINTSRKPVDKPDISPLQMQPPQDTLNYAPAPHHPWTNIKTVLSMVVSAEPSLCALCWGENR